MTCAAASGDDERRRRVARDLALEILTECIPIDPHLARLHAAWDHRHADNKRRIDHRARELFLDHLGRDITHDLSAADNWSEEFAAYASSRGIAIVGDWVFATVADMIERQLRSDCGDGGSPGSAS